MPQRPNLSPIVFFTTEAVQSRSLHGADVHEHIVPAIAGLDEADPLLGVKSLHATGRHVTFSLELGDADPPARAPQRGVPAIQMPRRALNRWKGHWDHAASVTFPSTCGNGEDAAWPIPLVAPTGAAEKLTGAISARGNAPDENQLGL